LAVGIISFEPLYGDRPVIEQGVEFALRLAECRAALARLGPAILLGLSDAIGGLLTAERTDRPATARQCGAFAVRVHRRDDERSMSYAGTWRTSRATKPVIEVPRAASRGKSAELAARSATLVASSKA